MPSLLCPTLDHTFDGDLGIFPKAKVFIVYHVQKTPYCGSTGYATANPSWSVLKQRRIYITVITITLRVLEIDGQLTKVD